MNNQIAINIGGMKYQIVSNEGNHDRLHRAVGTLLSEQSKRLREDGHDNLRATIMIAISALYEQDLLEEELKANMKELKELQSINTKYNALKSQYESLQQKHKKSIEEMSEQQKLNSEIKRLKRIEETHKLLLEKYESLQQTEQELSELTLKYKALSEEHTEIEEVMNFAIEETERLTQSIALHIDKEKVQCH